MDDLINLTGALENQEHDGARTVESTSVSDTLHPSTPSSHMNTSAAATVPSTSKYKVLDIVQHMFLIGLTSVMKWSDALSKIKKSTVVASSPSLLKMTSILSQLVHALAQHVLLNSEDLSQEKVPLLMSQKLTYLEIKSILMPLLKKKEFKEQVFSFNIFRDFCNAVSSALSDLTEIEGEGGAGQKKRKNEEISKINNKKSKRSKNKKTKHNYSLLYSSSSSLSDASFSSSSSSSSDSDGEFERIVARNKDTKRCIFIPQQFQFRAKHKTFKLETPGEPGTHLIKIEITDMKDLKSCKNQKNLLEKG